MLLRSAGVMLVVAAGGAIAACQCEIPHRPVGPDVTLQHVEPTGDLQIRPEDVHTRGGLIATIPEVGDVSDMRIERVDTDVTLHLLVSGTSGAA